MKVLEVEHLTRWSAFALWLAAAGFLPLRAIHPLATWLAVIGGFAGLIGIGRRSPVPWLVALREGILARRIATRARATIVGGGRVPDALVAILVGGLTWLVPLWAGAYAEKNPGLGATVFALVIYLQTALLFGRVVLGRRDPIAVTIGEDGVHLPDRGFVPYASITSASVRDDVLVMTVDGASVELGIGESGARLVRGAIASRRAKPVAPSAPEPAGFRVAAVPAELVDILRDGAQPRGERLRVAEVLRVAAPDEVERVASATADEELSKMLRTK
jgi:hypothetical protein